MKPYRPPEKWDYVGEDIARITFGPLQVICYPYKNGYTYQVGSKKPYQPFMTLENAQTASLRYLEKVAHMILDGLQKLPEYEIQFTARKPMPMGTLSILGIRQEDE